MSSLGLRPDQLDDGAMPNELGLEAFGLDIERGLASADVPPMADLTERVLRRVAAEPPTSAPRRLFGALAALDSRASLRGFRQTLAVAFGRSRIPAIVRYQAIAVLVLIVSVVGTAGVLGAAATISLADIVVPPQQRASEREPSARRPIPYASGSRSSGRASGGGSQVSQARERDDAQSATRGQTKAKAETKGNGQTKTKTKAKSKSTKAKPAQARVPVWAGDQGGGKAVRQPVKPRPSPTRSHAKDDQKTDAKGHADTSSRGHDKGKSK